MFIILLSSPLRRFWSQSQSTEPSRHRVRTWHSHWHRRQCHHTNHVVHLKEVPRRTVETSIDALMVLVVIAVRYVSEYLSAVGTKR